jgi:hypothetical protein
LATQFEDQNGYISLASICLVTGIPASKLNMLTDIAGGIK